MCINNTITLLTLLTLSLVLSLSRTFSSFRFLFFSRFLSYEADFIPFSSFSFFFFAFFLFSFELFFQSSTATDCFTSGTELHAKHYNDNMKKKWALNTKEYRYERFTFNKWLNIKYCQRPGHIWCALKQENILFSLYPNDKIIQRSPFGFFFDPQFSSASLPFALARKNK